jgi:predicted GIY-YIG superfamily endonuclease
MLVYSEEFSSRSEAMKRENEIKRWKSAVKVRELIACVG